MPVEVGPYCQHCVDESGNLQAFKERFERMTQWSAKRNPNEDRAEAERQTLAYMSKLPAWQNHPELLAKLVTD